MRHSFVSIADVVEVVAEFVGLPDWEVLLAMRGTCSGWREATQSAVRRIACADDETWHTASRLCAFASRIPSVARFCIVAGGDDWITEVPDMAFACGECLHSMVMFAFTHRLPLCTSVALPPPPPPPTPAALLSINDGTQTVSAVDFLASMPVGAQQLTALDLSTGRMALGVALNNTLQRLPHLVTLTLRDCESSVFEPIETIAAFEGGLAIDGARLESLTITLSHGFGLGDGQCDPDEVLETIGRMCPQLKSLCIPWLEASPDAAATFARSCAALEELTLSPSLSHTDETLCEFAAACPCLTSVDLSRASVTPASLEALGSMCPLLTSLTAGVEMVSLAALGAASGSMKVLRLYPHSNAQPLAFGRIAQRMPQLELIAIPVATLTLEDVVAIARQCPLLTSLDLCSCTFIQTAAAESDGGSLTQGAPLALRDFPVHCPRLQQLRLMECAAHVDDELLLAVAGSCPDLRLLNVDMCTRVTDAGVNAITTACHKLESLAIAGCEWTTNDAITQALAHCPFLQELQVSRTAGAGADFDVAVTYDSHPWLSFRRLTC